MTEQELKVKALELTIQTIALMSQENRGRQLPENNDPAEIIIRLSQTYLDYLQKKPI